MTTHIMSFTYIPKIDRVWSGEITQTIRKKRPNAKPKKVGDNILFHTWEGRPYRSKWGRRLLVEIVQLVDIELHHKGVTEGIFFHGWNTRWTNQLAMYDGIEPPMGLELYSLMEDYNGKDWEGEYEIIRWKL